MTAYDSWLEEPYQSSWDEDDASDSDPRQEFCQDEYLTEDELTESSLNELMEGQYALHCFLNDVDNE